MANRNKKTLSPLPSEIDTKTIKLVLTEPNKEGKRDLKVIHERAGKTDTIRIGVKSEAGIPMYITTYDADPTSPDAEKRFDCRRIGFNFEEGDDESLALLAIFERIDDMLLDIHGSEKYFSDVQGASKRFQALKFNSCLRTVEDGTDDKGKKLYRATGMRKNIVFDKNTGQPGKDIAGTPIIILSADVADNGKRDMIKGFGFDSKLGGQQMTLEEFKKLKGSYRCIELELDIPFVVRTPGVQYSLFVSIKKLVCYKVTNVVQVTNDDLGEFNISGLTITSGTEVTQPVTISAGGYGAEE